MGMLMCGAGFAQDALQRPLQHPPQIPATASARPPVAPDEGFIEFLGADDVDDAAWWEYLKRAPPPALKPGEPAPQDARK